MKKKTGSSKKIFLWSFVAVLLMAVFFSYKPGVPVKKLIPEYTYPESHFIPFRGMQVHYRVTGAGPALILLHGVASSLHTWEGWTGELSDEFRVISIDLPGFGLTGPNPDGDYSVDLYMHLLNTLLDYLKVDSCYMAGNSFGGYFTWNYALHDPERVKKLILIDAAGYDVGREITNPGFKMAVNPLTKGISHYITPYFLVKKSVEDVYGDPSKVTPETVQRYFDIMLREGNREAFSEILINLHSEKVNQDKIKNITQPALIMWGSEDRIIEPADALRFKDAIGNSTLIIYRGAGHIPMEEIPVKSAQDARNFLSENR